MKNQVKIQKYIISHNLVNRLFDMLYYFYFFKNAQSDYKSIKKSIEKSLKRIEDVESFAKFLELKLKKKNQNLEIKLNIKHLVDDLNFLKQLLD